MKRARLYPINRCKVLSAGWRATVVLGVMVAAPTARGATCDTLSAPQIVLVPVFTEPTLDTSLDLAGLQASSRNGEVRPVGHLLGLTTTKMVGSFEEVVEFAPQSASAGASAGFCGVAKEVHLRVGFEDVVVHIAREVIGDRCLYDQVRQHEGRHVQVDRDGLAEYGPRIGVAMRAMVTALGVVRGRTPDAVWQTIRQRVQIAFDAALSDFWQEMRRRQRFVDRPEEYRRLAEACGGAGARLVAASRRPPG
jgi:hypothetical protein